MTKETGLDVDDEPIYRIGELVVSGSVGQMPSFIGRITGVQKTGRGRYTYTVERRDEWHRDEKEISKPSAGTEFQEVTISASRRSIRIEELRKQHDARRGITTTKGEEGAGFISRSPT